MAGIINTGGSKGSGRGSPSTAESASEDDDASLDLYSDLIVDEHAGHSPRSSQNNNQATSSTELEKLKQEILKLKQQNDKLKNESEETSRRLQKKDSELSQLRKRTLSCGKCCSSVDLHDTGSWQGHSPFSPHSSFTSQTRAKPIAATATCQHKKRRISPELIVKYSESNLSNFSNHAFSQVGKGDNFHEYLKIFPDSRGGDSQDAGECSEVVVGECSDAVVDAQSEAVIGGKIPTQPPQFPVPFHTSNEISQIEVKHAVDCVSLFVPDDVSSKEVQHDSIMSKLVAEIADKSRLKSAKANQKKAVGDQEERPNSEMSTSKNENVSNVNTSSDVEVVKVTVTKSKSTKDSSEYSKVEKKESTSIRISSEKEKYKSHSRGRPEVKRKSRSPTRSSVQVHKHSKGTVETKPPRSVFDPVKGIWSEVPGQADVGHSEKHPKSSSKDVCSKARDETPDQKASAHTKDRPSESCNSRPGKEKSLHSSHSKSDTGKYSHSVSSKSDKDKSSQSLNSKSDKDKPAQSLNSRSDKDKSSQAFNSKSDKDKSSKPRHSKSDKSKSSQSLNPKSDKSKSSQSLNLKSDKGKSSHSLHSKSEKEKTDSHKHDTHHGSDKSQHQGRNRQENGSALKIKSKSSSDQHTSDKGDTRSSSKSKERYSKSKSKENLQDDKRSKPSSTSTDKQKDRAGTVPSTPRRQAVTEANFAFQNFTETLGLSSTSKSAPNDTKQDQADCDRERKTQLDEKNSDQAERTLLDTQPAVKVEQSAQNVSSHESVSSRSKPKDLLPKKIDSGCEETPAASTPLQEIQKNENQIHSHTEEQTHSKHKNRQSSSTVKTKEVSSVKHSSKETHRHSKGANKEVKIDKGSRSKGSTTVPSHDKSITQKVEDTLKATKDNAISNLTEQKKLGTKQTNDTDNCTEGHHVARGGHIHEEVCAESKHNDLLPKTSSEDAGEQKSPSGSKKMTHSTKEQVLSKSKSDENIEKCDKSKADVQVKKKRHNSSSSSKDKSTKSHVKMEDKKRQSDESSGTADKSDKAESVSKSKALGLPCASLCAGPLTKPFKIPKKKKITPEVLSAVESPNTEAHSECQVPQASDDHKSGTSLKDVAIPKEAKTAQVTQPALYGQSPRLEDKSYPVNLPLVQGTGGHHAAGIPSLLDLVCTPPAAKPPSTQEDGLLGVYVETGLSGQYVRPLMEDNVHTSMEIDQVDVESNLSNRPKGAAQRQNQPMNTIPDILLNLVSQGKVAEAVTSQEESKTDISDTAYSREQRKEQKMYGTDTKVTAIKVPKDISTGKKVRTTYPVPKPTRVIQMASDDEHLLGYMCLAKRRDKQSLINRKKNERAERKRVGAKKPTLDESLEGETVYGGCLPSSVVDIREEPEQLPPPELSPEEMKELWNQGVDVTDPDVLAEYWRMRYATEHVQRGASENIEVYPNEEMYRPSYIQSADVTTEERTVATAQVSEPGNSEDEEVVSSVVEPEGGTEPQINSGNDSLVSEDDKDCHLETKTIDSEVLPLKESIELPEQNAEQPEEEASFDAETPTKGDDSVLEHCHSGKDQLQSDLELSLSLSVSASEDSREADPGMPETQEKGKANSKTGSAKEESCESFDDENSGENHTQTSNTTNDDLTPTKTDEQGNVLENINRSEEKTHEQLSAKIDLVDRRPAMALTEKDCVQVSTVKSSLPKQDTEKLTEKKPTQEVNTKKCDALKLFGKESEPARLVSSDGLNERGNIEKENILICEGNSRGAEKRKASPDLNTHSRKRLELELFGEDSIQISMDASDIVKHNKQLVQTSFVTDQKKNIEKEKILNCEGNNKGAEKRKASPDGNAHTRKRLELELFGEDSIQISMDASDIVKHNKQLVQTSFVTGQNTGTEKDVKRQEPQLLLPKAEDGQDSGDDSDLDVGDSEFAIDPSAVKIEIDLSEGDSADSWVNNSQSVPEDVEHTTSVDQVLESSADICNTPIIPIGNAPVDDSRIAVMKSHNKDLNVPSNIDENKVPNKDIKCNGFEENVDGEKDEVSIDATQSSDVKKEEDNVDKNESIKMENQTVMKVPEDTYCTEKQESSKMAEHSKDRVVTQTIVDSVDLVDIKRSESDVVQESEDSEPLAKNEDLDVTDEGKDADITEESLIDIEESSDVSSEGVCAGDEMSEDQDSTLIDDPSKDDDEVVNDTCSLASESGGSSLDCRSTTEDELDELDEDIPYNDSLDKTLLEDKSPELAGVNVDDGEESECDDVLELHAGDLSMFDEESVPPSEVNLTPRRSPRKKPSTSTPRTTKPFRTPTKDRFTPRTAKPSRTPTKDQSTPTSRVKNTPSQRTPTLKKESVVNKKSAEREIEEGEAVSDEEEYKPRRKDRISSSRSRTPPHHHSSNKRRRSASRDKDSKRVCSDSNRRTDSGSSRRHHSLSSRYVSSRDRISSHRDSRHHPKRSTSPEHTSSNRRSGRSENYSHSHRDSKKDSPRIDVSARQSSRRIR